MFQTTLDEFELDDLMTCVRALLYTGLKMESYTKSKLEDVHQRIKTKLAGLPKCVTQCSLRNQRRCITCSEWEKELRKVVKRPQVVRWEKSESWTWPDSYECIVPVFVSTGHDTTNNALSDISVACKIWDSCTETKVKEIYVKNVRNARNAIFHNLQVTPTEKAKVFDALKDLLKDPDVQTALNVNQCLGDLEEIQRGSKDYLEKLKNKYTLQNLHQQFQIDLASVVEEIRTSVNNISDILENRENTDLLIRNSLVKSRKLVALIFFLLIISVFYFKAPHMQLSGTYHPKEMQRSNRLGCISENYNYPFPQDFPHLSYILMKHDFKLIGREWLINDIESVVLQKSTTFRGIVITADMGYGKSAVVSHLLCVPEYQKGYRLKKDLVAFHICKFDVPSTKSPERFIRRLVGFFSMKSAEYGSVISRLSNHSVLYNREVCEREIEACFDQAIKLPFLEMNDTDGTWIVIIDALDECYSTTLNTNEILDLLSSRIQYFPKWIKFIITSRQISQLNQLSYRKMKILELSSNDSNNIQDIKLYVNKIYEMNTIMPDNKAVERFLSKTEGNFLYAFHALDYILYTNRLENEVPALPETLEEIYVINFDRLFRGRSYDICKTILEIICTTSNPMTKTEIYQIIKDEPSLNSSMTSFERQFQLLSFFLNTEGVISFKHKSIHNFLLSESHEIYKISTKRGHFIFSKYLLKSFTFKNNTEKQKCLVELIIHLSESDDKGLRKTFELNFINDTMNVDMEIVLHDLIKATSSAKALGLLLKQHKTINFVGRKEMSPIFLSASKGHLEQLELLYSYGGYVNFAIPGCFCVNRESAETYIDDIKTKLYTGYTALHIAVQHNFENVVIFLISRTNININKTNLLGMRASDIACENGNLEILQNMQRYAKNVLDDTCLYYATKSGHDNIIRYAFRSTSGLLTNCISNVRAEKELKRINRTCKCAYQPYTDWKDITDHGTIHALDRWWVIRQETALHVAIRRGYDEIAMLIMKNRIEIEKCSDAFGFRPQLLAIKYGRHIIMSNLTESKYVSVCSPIAKHLEKLISENNNIIDMFIKEDICPEGASFSHLIAIYNRIEMLHFWRKYSSQKWNTRDIKGNLPVHYAACHSVQVLNFYKERLGTNIFTEQTKNGSSVYHLAALCHIDSVLQEIMITYNEVHSQEYLSMALKDNDNKTILHYSVLWDQQGTMYNRNKDRVTALIAFNFFSYFINVTEVDRYGNTALHYLLKNGHWDVVQKSTEKLSKSDMRQQWLNLKNNDGLGAAEFALIFAQRDQVFVVNDIFYESKLYSAEGLDNAYKWEVCLMTLIDFMSQIEIGYFAERNMNMMIMKSPFITKFVFQKMRPNKLSKSTETNLQSSLTKTIKMSKYKPIYPFTEISLLAISLVNPRFLHVCGMPLSCSPFHFMVLNSFSYDKKIYNVSTINMTLENILNKEILGCDTAEGLNIIHYALIGGNVDLAVRLKYKGIPILTASVFAIDIIKMVNYAKFLPNTDQILKTDKFAAKFIAKHKNMLKTEDFCNNKSLSLSLIHIICVNGMVKTVRRISNLFGSDILRCVNDDGFSCLYFATFFGNADLEKFLKFKKIPSDIPNLNAEESLVMNVVNMFPLTRHKSILTDLIKKSTSLRFSEIRLVWKTFHNLYEILRKDHVSFIFGRYFSENFIFLRHGLHLFEKVLVKTQILRMHTMDSAAKEHVDCQFQSSLIASIQEALQQLKYWSEIRNRALEWTQEYPFLTNIRKILELPEKYNQYFPTKNEPCRCPLGDSSSTRHILYYLDKVNRVFVNNFRNIYMLWQLMDQKSFAKFADYPGIFPKSVLVRRACPLLFPTSLDDNGGLTKGAVYLINRFRYLNQIKSSVAYKEISKRGRNYRILVIGNMKSISNKIRFMGDMINNTTKRVKWMSRYFKSENIKCCRQTYQTGNANDDHLFNDQVLISIPYF